MNILELGAIGELVGGVDRVVDLRRAASETDHPGHAWAGDGRAVGGPILSRDCDYGARHGSGFCESL